MTPSVVVFDIGGVLVDWQPHRAWESELGSREAAEAFMARTDFFAKNARGDAGERFSDMAQEIDDPEDARRFADYVARYEITVPNPVAGTWEILDLLKANGTPVHAITNWSAETWPLGVKAHPRLANAFGTTIVSGHEGIIKPDAKIFALLCERAGVRPAECVFVDDSQKNVDGARAAGWDAVRFVGADQLRLDLVERGLLQ